MIYNMGQKGGPVKGGHIPAPANTAKASGTKPSELSTTTKIVLCALAALAVVALCLALAYPASFLSLISWTATHFVAVGTTTALVTLGIIAFVATRNQGSSKQAPSISTAKESSATKKTETNPVKAKTAPTLEQQDARKRELHIEAAEERVRKAEAARVLAYKDLNHPDNHDVKAQLIAELKLHLNQTNNIDIEKIRRDADKELEDAKKARSAAIAGTDTY